MTQSPPSSPAADRNTGPILQVLRAHLPARGRVLEIASGVGQHAAAIARALPDLDWTPSDPSMEAREGIEAWRKASGLDNLRAAEAVDAADPAIWPSGPFHAVVCINMVHISPWAATEGLMRGAAAVLKPGAPLILYGPYRRAGVPTAPSNEAFDASLKARDPQWGLRQVEDVEAEALRNHLHLERVVEMPANNLTLVFRRV